ncbi:MAG: sulfatase-like hydrolase/transferase, partial [Candidatus Omnitrophica bacterium]|nr:sulfatase-like hydrolase/transferase [Candidatus Omnitrophota bacterium]
ARPSEAEERLPDRGDARGKPNILFIMTDQQRYDCLGANGNRIIQTPNLDRLTSQSANFSHCYVQAPVCVPSRACFFTGRYAHSHRNRVNYTKLPSDETLMQHRLREAGYSTCLVGKTHLYYNYPPTREEAMRTGFDTVELHDGAGSTDPWSDYVKWRNQNDPKKNVYYRALARPEKDVGYSGKTNPFLCAIDEEFTDTSWTGLKTREHLKRLAEKKEPFFLFSSYWKPHSPFEVPRPFDSLYNDVDFELPKQESLEDIRKLPLPLQKLILRGNHPPYDMDRKRLEWIYRSYYGSITHIDREVGMTLDTLDKLGLRDNTIVVFCSDHGDQLLEHGLMGKNVFFEASERVPFMIRFPGKIQPGQYDDFLETIDVLPTLFELIGLEEPYPCQGQSMVPLISGEGKSFTPRDCVFSENVIPEVFSSSFFFEKDRGVKGIRHPDAKMIRTRDWKFNYYPEGYAELYHLKNDPMEQRNLAGDPGYQNTERELKDRILDWLINSVETDQIAERWLV